MSNINPFDPNEGDRSDFKQNDRNFRTYRDNSFDPQGNDPFFANGRGYSVFGSKDTFSIYMAKTFAWMAAGLFLTFAVGFWLYISGTAIRLYYSFPMVWMVLAIAELAVVGVMGFRVRKLSAAGATVLFFLYAALNGFTFAMLFLTYQFDTMIYAFGLTAVFFGGMTAVATIFKLDLSRIRNYLFASLIFLLIFGIFAAVTRVPGLIVAECYLGIAIFICYTAYDVRKIAADYQYYSSQPELLRKASIYSALSLYLDFVNLFIRILRIFGNSRRR